VASGTTRSQPDAELGSSDSQPSGLAPWLATHCPAEILAALLTVTPEELTEAAITALGRRGGPEHCSVLVPLLHCDSDRVAALAEDSLWRLWLRGGSPQATRALAEAIELVQANRLSEALMALDRLALAEPTFAEVHNQRGIALCLLGRLDEAAEAFREALRHNQHHFSAAVSLAHTYAQRGQLRPALRQYRRALQINPRLDGVREIVERLEAIVGDGSVSPR